MAYVLEAVIKAAKLANISKPLIKSLVSKLDESSFLIDQKGREYRPSTVGILFYDICTITGIKPEKIKNRDRSKTITYTRHAFAAIARSMFPKEKYPEVTLDYIGSFINVKHDMILYYLKEVSRKRAKREYCEDIQRKLTRQII